jgi:hypothetical protein
MRSRLHPFYTNSSFFPYECFYVPRKVVTACAAWGKKGWFESRTSIICDEIIFSTCGSLKNQSPWRQVWDSLFLRIKGCKNIAPTVSYRERAACAVRLKHTISINYVNLIKMFGAILFLQFPVKDHNFLGVRMFIFKGNRHEIYILLKDRILWIQAVQPLRL